MFYETVLSSWEEGHMPIPELRRQRQAGICEFKAVVYRGSSRPARAAEGNPVSKHKQANKSTVLSRCMLLSQYFARHSGAYIPALRWLPQADSLKSVYSIQQTSQDILGYRKKKKMPVY